MTLLNFANKFSDNENVYIIVNPELILPYKEDEILICSKQEFLFNDHCEQISNILDVYINYMENICKFKFYFEIRTVSDKNVITNFYDNPS